MTKQEAFLNGLVIELIKKHKCHTVILYGSHARGDATEHSDFDIMGVRKSGKPYRAAEKRNGTYLDMFVYPEKELQVVGEHHLHLKDAKVLFEKDKFGTQFLKKVKAIDKKKHKSLPADEIHTRRVWLHKMFDRVAQGDIEGDYRRSWLHEALLTDYSAIRKKRYWGSKQSFAWLKEHDRTTYRLFEQVLARPLDLKLLKKLVERVSGLKNHAKTIA